RVARLEVVLVRRRGAVLETLLAPHLAAAGDRLGLAEPQVVLHVALAVARVQARQRVVALADLAADDVAAERERVGVGRDLRRAWIALEARVRGPRVLGDD